MGKQHDEIIKIHNLTHKYLGDFLVSFITQILHSIKSQGAHINLRSRLDHLEGLNCEAFKKSSFFCIPCGT